MDEIASRRHGQGVSVDRAAAHRRELDECLSTAIALHRQGNFDEAKQLYLALLGAEPDHFDATRLLGMMADQLGQSSIACDLLGRATAQQPGNVDVLYHYALALQHADHPDQAAGVYAQAFVLAPDQPRIAENLAVALVDAGREDDAIEVCLRALALDETSAIAHSNLGTLYLNRGDTLRARRHLERLVELRPALAQAREKLSTVYLREGDYAKAWPLYEWRFANDSFLRSNRVRHGAYPTWAGEALAGRTILVTPEQGVGDEVMFASCFDELIEQAQHVVIQCDERLQPLFARSFSAATVLGRSAPPTDLQIDCCVTAGSLPRFFRSSLDAFRGHAYLTPDPQRVEFWRTQLALHEGAPVVGMSWRAGRDPRAQQARSVDLQLWRSIFAESSARFFDLQYGDHGVEINACASAGLPTPTKLAGIDPLQNLDDFAALIVALDLVITVDNSTAHIAGALGVPTWVWVPAGAEWRWGERDAHTPWYDSVRLFRQSQASPGDWRPVIDATAKALNEFAAAQVKPVQRSAQAASPTRRESVTDARAVLLNDTRNWYHFGCTGTSLALHHQLRKRYREVVGVPITDTINLAGVPDTLAGFNDPAIADAFCTAHAPLLDVLATSDHVYVNGEGTLHGRSPAACSLLYLAWLSAMRLGKPVSIINHSAYPGDDEGQAIYSAVYRALAGAAVREPVSARAMRALGVNVIDTFDSLPVYIDELYQPGSRATSDYAVLAGGVTWHEGTAAPMRQLIRHLHKAHLDVVVLLGARAHPAGEELRFAEAVLLEHGEQVRMVHAHTEREWLDTIGGARLLVSGRFHHSIAAAFLGTPLVASDSNTPKISGLMEACVLPPPVQAPRDWAGADVQRFADELCARTAMALSDPKALLLTCDVRRRMLDLARAGMFLH